MKWELNHWLWEQMPFAVGGSGSNGGKHVFEAAGSLNTPAGKAGNEGGGGGSANVRKQEQEPPPEVLRRSACDDGTNSGGGGGNVYNEPPYHCGDQ